MSYDVEKHAQLKAAVDRLRYSNPEKFYTMCKMHLTFSVNLPNDELSSFLDEKQESRGRRVFAAFQRKMKSKGEIFGAPLTQEGISQLYQLIQFLGRDHNICQEGLFRKSGKLSRQQSLKQLLNQGISVDLDNGEFSVHDCASVLKAFLGELPEPLLTEGHYRAHCQVPDMYRNSMQSEEKKNAFAKQIKTVQLLFMLLPRENYQLLGDLLTLLHRVTRVKDNKMSSENLATMFAPHLLCPKKMSASELQNKSLNMTRAVAFMVENAPVLFQVPGDLAQDILTYWKDKELELQNFKKDRKPTDPEAVRTSVSFVDREKTQMAQTSTTTDQAVAELFAYVQSLPESSKKQRLIKQFNKCNGYGTPLYYTNGNRKHSRSKSLGDTLRRRFPFRSLKVKDTSTTNTNSTATSFDDLDLSVSSSGKSALRQDNTYHSSLKTQNSKKSLKSEKVIKSILRNFQ